MPGAAWTLAGADRRRQRIPSPRYSDRWSVAGDQQVVFILTWSLATDHWSLRA